MDFIDPKFRDVVIGIGRAIDDVLNPGWDKGRAREHGFALLVFSARDEAGDVNFLSNVDHARLEGAIRGVLAHLKPAEEKTDGPCLDNGH